LTPRRLSSTFTFEEKGRLKILYVDANLGAQHSEQEAQVAEVLRQMREHAARRDAYTVADVLESLPNVSRVVGLPERNDGFVEIVKGKKDEFWHQLEQDITAVLILVPLDTLRSCYAKSLMNEPEVGGVFYEVHGAALLLRAGATALDLHVPRAPGEKPNFDIRAWFGTVAINSDSKVRSDNFLFRQADDSSPVPGVPTFSATSETIDRHDAEKLGIAGPRKTPIKGARHRDTPESTSVRQILAATLAKQLPPSGINLVLLGQVGGDETSIEDALLGQDRLTFRQEQGTGKCGRTHFHGRLLRRRDRRWLHGFERCHPDLAATSQ
jgi:hypothetical protein